MKLFCVFFFTTLIFFCIGQDSYERETSIIRKENDFGNYLVDSLIKLELAPADKAALYFQKGRLYRHAGNQLLSFKSNQVVLAL